MTPPTLPTTLVNAARDGRLIPFVGAGVSMAVRRTNGEKAFPSWAGLLESSVDRLREEGKTENAKEIRALLDLPKPNFLDIATRASDALGSANWRRFLRAQLDPARAEIAEDSLDLAKAIWALGSTLVVTTNYDRVLSWACAQVSDLRQWRIQSEGDLVDLLGGRLERPCLWQLHGSIDDPTQLILTPDGYHELYGNETRTPRHEAALMGLRNVIAGHHLLFVGFSLDDEFVARQFDWVHQTFLGCDGPHYVLVRAAEVTRMREKLKGTSIQAIPFDDFGEPLVRLLRVIADTSVATHLAEQPAQPRCDIPDSTVPCPAQVPPPSPEPTLGEEAPPDEHKSLGPSAFVLHLVLEVLDIVITTCRLLLKTGIPIFALLALFWMNLWIGIAAWTSIDESGFGTQASIYALVSILLITPLSIHRMLKFRTKQQDGSALATTLAFLTTMAGAVFFPCFVAGLGGLRARTPNGIFGYVEVALLSILFLYWGHIAWWGAWGSPVLGSPFLAAAVYGSPVALFLLGVWWEPLHSWYDDKYGVRSHLEPHPDSDEQPASSKTNASR